MLAVNTDSLVEKLSQRKTLNVLVSVYDKTHLVDFLNELKAFTDVNVIATGGTYKHLNNYNINCIEVSSLTNFPEILDGRVKTLHPAIFGGILARNMACDLEVLEKHKIPQIDLIIVNLYPFLEKAKANLPLSQMQEFIDIGGVSLLRAGAKNYENVLYSSWASTLSAKNL